MGRTIAITGLIQLINKQIISTLTFKKDENELLFIR